MPADFVSMRIEGEESLDALAAAFKATGDKGLNAALRTALTASLKNAKKVARRAALQDLPSSGGLNAFVAKSSFGSRVNTGRNPSVRLTGSKKGHDLRAIDRGRLRHPVFGNRNLIKSGDGTYRWTWVTQQIDPGWWTNAMEDEVAPVARRDLAAAMGAVADLLVDGVKAQEVSRAYYERQAKLRAARAAKRARG